MDQAESTQAGPQALYALTPNSASGTTTGTSIEDTRAPLHGFDDFNNDFLLSDLEWDSLGDHACGSTESKLGGTGCAFFSVTGPSLVFPDRFNDLDLSLVDLDILEWGMPQDKEEDSGGSDDDSDTFHMFEMYGSDWGDGQLEQ